MRLGILALAAGCLAFACGTESGTPVEELEETEDEVFGYGCTAVHTGCLQGGSINYCCGFASCYFLFSDGAYTTDTNLAIAYCNGQIGPAAQSGGGSAPPPSAPPPSSSTPQCYGSSSSCSSQGRSGCNNTPGCWWEDEECYGSAARCSSFGSYGSCYAQGGCYWDNYDNRCYGSAWQCGGLYGSGCNRQYGCYLSYGQCRGSAQNLCAGASERTCRSTYGCSWR